MAVDFNFPRFRLNLPSLAPLFESFNPLLALGGTIYPCSRRTHPCAPCNLVRTIHKLDKANSVTNCAVFFFKPR